MAKVEVVSAEELKTLPLFERLPYKFLTWNPNAVVRRTLTRGELLFREGEYGSTAFILESGTLSLEVRAALYRLESHRSNSWVSRLGGRRVLLRLSRIQKGQRQDGGRVGSIRTDGAGPLRADEPYTQLTPDLYRVIGEGACLNSYPRFATATAAEPTKVLEFRRNVLLALMRNPSSRSKINEAYRQSGLASYLMAVPFFAVLEVPGRTRCAEFLQSRTEALDFVRVQPGQVIFRRGDPADDLYLVRVGFVKVSVTTRDEENVLDYVGPGGLFGEFGPVSQHAPVLASVLPRGLTPGVRLTTCTALDSVELVRIRGAVFTELLRRDPSLLPPLIEGCRQQIEKYWGRAASRGVPMDVFLSEGLEAGRDLLVLDLERCTRCDECTKACADSHDGVTRLIREGIRFGNYLIATACHSCMNPYCMAGCPVDAIHRGKDREIGIEDWCIGCGLCEANCPYGNIRMVEQRTQVDDPDHPGQKAVVEQRKALTCDLCQGFLEPGETPSCVYACPHDAAFRMNGEQLLKIVKRSDQES